MQPGRPAGPSVPEIHTTPAASASDGLACAPGTAGLCSVCPSSAQFPSHLAGHELGELGEGQRGPVGTRLEQPLEDHFVEVALCAPHKELIELRSQGGRQ